MKIEKCGYRSLSLTAMVTIGMLTAIGVSFVQAGDSNFTASVEGADTGDKVCQTLNCYRAQLKKTDSGGSAPPKTRRTATELLQERSETPSFFDELRTQNEAASESLTKALKNQDDRNEARALSDGNFVVAR